MIKFLNGLVILSTLVIVGACGSNNVKRYRADMSIYRQLKKYDIDKINTVNVTMAEGDRCFIMCRMSGNIYLPNNITYSKYIEDAFEKVLMYSDGQKKTKNLKIELTKVDVNTVSGKWTIKANAYIDGQQAKEILSVTKFGTAYVADSACRNAAEVFEDAVTEFIEKVIQNV